MAFKPSIKNVLITGSPGVGKTTCIRHIVDALSDKNNRYSSMINLNGFYSLERRKSSQSGYSKSYRIGFDIISVVDGSSNMLARTEQELPRHIYDKYKMGSSVFKHVSKYIMDVINFEKFTLPLLSVKSGSQNHKQIVFIIDEIGKMELFSHQFQKYVESHINNSEIIVIATVPLKHSIPFVEKLKRRKDSKLYELTRNNRNASTMHITKCVFELIDSRAKNKTQHQHNTEEAKDNDNNDKNHNPSYYNPNQHKSYRKKL